MASLPTAMRAARPALMGAFAAVVLGSVLGAMPAAAEFQLGAYGGISESFDSDVTLIQPNGTNLTLSDVPWDGKSFTWPPYWGVRGIYWIDSHPNWGLMVDYHHAKIYSDLGGTVGVSGTRDGVAVGGREQVGTTFEVLEFTDGLNQIFFGGTYRWWHDRWTPYAGFGVGFAFPHVEVKRHGPVPKTFDYQVTGVAVEGLIGVEYHINDRLSAFGEYKLSFSSNDAELDGGGTLETDVWTNHFTLGLSYRFGAPAPGALMPASM